MIAIVDYGLGNLGSIKNMFKKIGCEAIITGDHNEIAQADQLILPGVGAFDNGMHNLAERGLVDVLEDQVLKKKKPVLGICLGFQIMTNLSEEGSLEGLGWIDATVKRFQSNQNIQNFKVPHMGWNTIDIEKKSILFNEMMDQENRFYFVHSYYVQCENREDVLATTNYGGPFDSIVNHENIYATQFHPEKSHRFGMQLLRNFAELISC